MRQAPRVGCRTETSSPVSKLHISFVAVDCKMAYLCSLVLFVASLLALAAAVRVDSMSFRLRFSCGALFAQSSPNLFFSYSFAKRFILSTEFSESVPRVPCSPVNALFQSPHQWPPSSYCGRPPVYSSSQHDDASQAGLSLVQVQGTTRFIHEFLSILIMFF
jgi:hypothetical protein